MSHHVPKRARLGRMRRIHRQVGGRFRFLLPGPESALRRAEAALAESEACYRQLVECSAEGLLVVREGVILDANPASALLLDRLGASSLVGGALVDLFYPDDRPRVNERMAHYRRTGQPLPQEVLRVMGGGGSIRWAEVEPAPTTYGGAPAVRVLLRDVTRQVAARQELADHLKALREAQRIAHLGSWYNSLDQGRNEWSDETYHILGLRPGDVEPGYEAYLSCVPPEDHELIHGVTRKLWAERSPQSYENRIRRPDGEVRWVHAELELALDARGEPVGVRGTFQDITEQKQAAQLGEDRRVVTEMVARNQPLAEVLQRVIQMVVAQCPALRPCILQVKPDARPVALAAALPQTFLEGLQDLGVGPGTGVCVEAVRQGQTVITEDMEAHPLWPDHQELVRAHGLRACWAIPFRGGEGRVLGVLAVFREQPGTPDGATLALLDVAAQLAAVAVDHHELAERIAHQSQHDALTGLPNRMLFGDRLTQAIAQARRSATFVAVLFLDLDQFKHVNDTLGHAVGDILLREAAVRIASVIRQSDSLARVSGDEFAVAVQEIKEPQDAVRVVQKILAALKTPFNVAEQEVFLGASAGISLFPVDGEEPGALLQKGESAMYRAKTLGRNTFQWFAADMNASAHARMALEGQLHHALQREEFLLHYQPQFSALGQVQGFEALLRWVRPGQGMVSPATFIPLAEDTGLIVPIGEWVLREACRQMVAWGADKNLAIAVNVSTLQFQREDWVETVQRALDDTGMNPRALELEITESLLIKSGTRVMGNLQALRAMGVAITIDDFGTGYSSLSYLHRLPVTTLKIDQSFVREIGEDTGQHPHDAPIVRTIITLAHTLGMRVVAEGVETELQRDLLLGLGCESLQGYLLARPMPAAEVVRYLPPRTIDSASEH